MYSIIDDNSPEEQRKYNEAINRINNMTPQDLGLNPTNDFEEFNMQQIINYDPQKAQEYASKGPMDIFEAGNNFASSFNGTDNPKLKTNSMSIIDQSIENKKKEKFEFDGTYSNIDNNANLTALGRGLKNSSYNQTVEDRIERDRLKKLERNQRVNDGTANILDRVGSALDRWGENSIQGQAQVNANTMEFKQTQNIIYDQADLTKKIDFWEGMRKSISRGENLPVLGEAMKGFDDKKERTIEKKIRNGEPIRQDELDFINHRIDKRNEEAIRGYTIGGEIGKYLPQTIAFMGEMFIGGVGMKALGLTDKLSKVGLNSAKFARSLGAGKGLAKGLGYTSKILANTGVNAAITTITNPASFFATYQERMLNNEMKITDYGTTIFQQSQESPAKAFFKSLGQTYISYFSEGLGGLVTPAFNGIAKGGSVATQQFINVLTRNPQLKKLIDNSAPIFAKAYEKMNGMQAVGKSAEWLKSKVKFDGFIEELSEEVLEDVLNLTVGTNNEERSLKNYASAIFKSPEEWAVLAGVIALQGGALSIAGNMLGGQMEKNGNSVEEIAQVLMTSSENEKNELLNELQLQGQITVDDIRSDEQIKEDLAKDKIQKEFYDKLISIGKSEEEALRTSEVARMMFASMGSNTEAKQKWFDNLFITKDVEVEDSAKVAKQLFQSAEVAGSNGNVEEAKKEWQKKGTESKYFKKWFGDSKVVDEDGKPLVVYHGTPEKFSIFDKNRYGDGQLGKGFYFTTSKQEANEYSKNGKTLDVYLNIKNPFDIDAPIETISQQLNIPIEELENLTPADVTEQIKQKGFDGVVAKDYWGEGNDYYMVFEPEQIKSVDNQGTFDSENPNIYFQGENEWKTDIDFDLNEYLNQKEVKENIKKSTENFIEQIEKIKNGKLDTQVEPIVLFKPTKILTRVGISNVKITFNQSKIKKNIKEHNLTYEQIKKIPEALANPEYIFESTTDNNAYVVVLDKNKKPFIVALTKVGKNYKIKNIIKSAYNKGVNFVKDNIRNGRLLYDKSNPTKFRQHRASIAQAKTLSDTNIIPQFQSDINPNIKNDEDSPEYNNQILFQPAYHGTPHKFDKFSTEHIGTGEGNQAHGWGLYFAKDKDVSKKYREVLINAHTEIYNRYYAPVDIVIKYKDTDYRFFYGQIETGETDCFTVGDRRKLNEDEEYILHRVFDYIYDEVGNKKSFTNKDFEEKINEILDSRNYWHVGQNDEKIQEIKSSLKNAKFKINKEKSSKEAIEEEELKLGQLYQVDIPENDVLLDENKKFYKQPKKVQEALLKLAKENLTLDKNELFNFTAIPVGVYLNGKEIGKGEFVEFALGIEIAKKYGKDVAIEKLEQEKNKASFNITDFKEVLETVSRFNGYIEYIKNVNLDNITIDEREFNKEEFKNKDGEQIYDFIVKKIGSPKQASLLLDEYGIKGITYKGMRDGRCYVVFDDKAVDIIETYFQDSIDQNQFEIDLMNKARAFADDKYNEEQNKNRKANEKNLTEKQKRFKDTAYNILWFAVSHDNNPELSKLIKHKKQLAMLLGNTKQAQNSKVTIRTREKLENLIRELTDEITQNGKPPEWDEFFDTTVSDAELAYRAYKVIIDKEYLNSFDDNAEFKHQEEAIQKTIYEFDYLIQKFKKASKNKNEDLMQKIDLAFLEWSEYADPIIQEDVINKWYEETNRIKTNDNLSEEELAKGYGEYLSIHNDKKQEKELKYLGYYAKVGEKSLINIMSGSNSSTIVHELAHFFLTGLNQMAGIDEQAREKLILINNWLGADGSGHYSVKQQEKFARSFEAYLYTGKAPTSKLREVFNWFRNMLKEIYAHVSMIPEAEISQEAQDLFNKIFSEDEYDDKFAMDIYSKAKNIRVGKTKITNKNIENKLDEVQLRHRKASYEILSRATGKTEQYLKLILENKKDDKNVGNKIEELENQLNNLDNKISSSGEFNPEWLEFFDNEALFTSGNDEMLAKEAFLTILNKAYRSYANAYDFDNALEAQYNYIIKQYKDVENRTATLGAFNIWLDGLKLDEDKEYYNEKFNNDANEIERYENLDEIEKAKQKILKELEFFDDIQDLSKEDKYRKQVRAIVGGIKFLNAVDKAKLLTNILDVPNKAFMKGRLNDLFDIAKTMQDVNERRILAKKISEEIINTKNIKKGNNTVGKYDYRTNKFFEQLRDFNKLAREKAQEELQARREAIKADEGISFEDKFVNKFLSFKANGLNYTDTHTLQSLYDDILKIKRTAKEAKDEIEFSEKLNNEKAKDEVIEVLHGVKANPKFSNDIIKWMGNLYSSMNYLFNKNIAEKYSMEYLNTKTTAWVENEKRKFKNAVQEIYGRNNWNWRDDIINNTNEIKQHTYYKRTFDVTGEIPIKVEEIPIKLNKMHYILAYIWNKNEVLSARLENMFGKEQLEDMLSSLTVQDEKLGDYMVNMTTSYYHQVNKIYIEKFGIDMPRVNAYFPSKVETDKISEFDLLNDFTSQSLGRSFIKQRTKAENVVMDFNDPVEILMGHISNVGKFINEGIEIDKINKIFLDKRVKREVINKFDEKAYKILTDNLAAITYKNHAQEYNKADEKFSELANNFIGANVMVKPTIVLKQLLSMTNYSVDMPYNEWFKGLTKALLHPKQTIDFMMKIPYIKARFESGGQNEALKDFMKFNYTKLKNAKFNARIATLKEYLSLNVRYGDIGAIIFGGKPYYDYLIKQGLTKEEAEKKFIESTVRSQQSSEVSTLSAFQRDASKKGANRLFTAYRNASIQYIRAIDDAVVQYQRGEINKKQLAKTLFNFLILQPYLYEAVGSATVLQWLFGNGDFIDVLMEILHSIPNGLLGGFGLLGDLAKDIINNVIFGEKVYQSTIPVIADLQRDIQILSKEDLSFEDVVKAFADISKIITGAPLDSISNMAGGVGDIATGKAGKGVLRVAGYTKNRAEKITGEK